MANIAIFVPGIGDLSGGGGAERFFFDFFQKYQHINSKNKLYFITDRLSVENFKLLNDFSNSKRLITYRLFHNRYKEILEFFEILIILIKNRIQIIQIPLYNLHFYNLIKRIDSLPKILRPKIIINITDCRIPHYYFEGNKHGHNFKKTYEPLFNDVHIDGVISWYKLFRKFAHENNLIKSNPSIFCINSRYSGKSISPNKQKENLIVFAARFVHVKQPLFFIEAIYILTKQKTNFRNWKFKMYGKGDLSSEVLEAISKYNLQELITIDYNIDMTSVFEKTKCFVSTQSFENFPSLSMNEAMAAGNVIISRNVGQTDLFVKDGVNGILLKSDNPTALAEAIIWFINNPEKHLKMGMESVKLTTQTHNFENFKDQLELFWHKILNE